MRHGFGAGVTVIPDSKARNPEALRSSRRADFRRRSRRKARSAARGRLVLTSTVWSSLRGETSLGDVRVPTLVVHNRDDGCRQSPFSSASDGVAALQHAPVKEFIAVSGGSSRSAPPGLA